MTEGENQGSDDTFNRFLSFSLGSEEYAIPLLSVREVMGMPDFTPVPQSPPFFLGIMNLRGQVISVIDLRIKLGMKPQVLKEMAVIICDLKQIVLGVVVDSVNSVISPQKEDIKSKPDLKSARNSDYITGVYKSDKNLVMFLNLIKALNLDEQNMLLGASNKSK
jgi:purine-binding chemotaxis protein CheW